MVLNYVVSVCVCERSPSNLFSIWMFSWSKSNKLLRNLQKVSLSENLKSEKPA